MEKMELIRGHKIKSKGIYFTKMTGSNNDFVVIDNRTNIVNDRSQFARLVCQRRISVGADGLILIEKSKKTDFKMGIFNPDGTEAEMCGNGARCAVSYACLKIKKNCLKNSKLKFETKAGILEAEVIAKDIIKLKIPPPTNLTFDIRIDVDKVEYLVHYINTGVPHTVLFVPDIEDVDVYNIGRNIRYYANFQPQGTNVDFVKIKNKRSIYVRTYERGVENETLACGTGAVASAIIASLKKNLTSPVEVYTRGGDILKVYFKNKNDKIYDVYLEGKVKIVYEGKIAK